VSAIDIHIGTQAPVDRAAALDCDTAGLSELEAARRCVPQVSATHNGLERMLWIRRALEDLLSQRSYYIADGETLGLGDSRDRARLWFVIDPPFARPDMPPWVPLSQPVMDRVGLIGEAAKMGCPTWDLPAGSPLVGGSCPGAAAGQSIIPLPTRRKVADAAAAAGIRLEPTHPSAPGHVGGERVSLPTTVCQICYAEGGNYQYASVQIGELVRYWWCRSMFDRGKAGFDEWVATVVRAIAGEMFPTERAVDPRTGNPIVPMRLHSSGDFFSPTYAAAWVAVANELPEVMFWAPTRTWAAAGWIEHWRRLLPTVKHGNLAVRPSAYHTGDAAPSIGRAPWSGPYPFIQGHGEPTAGTTSIYKFDDAGADRGVSRDPRYDWACQTYAILDDAHSCSKALAPDGGIGCRACWLHPELRINYTTH
jgi:hypothetical protein